jgi:LysR family transcriptional regulator, hydrogen peroxide-inducible genes activator
LGAEAGNFATHVSIKALHYLIALAECLNFSRAANRCAVTQPTLSIQVRKLEEYLGVTLFDRNCARVVLTDEGANVLRIARIVVAAADEILLFRRTRCATNAPITRNRRSRRSPP